LIDPVNIFIVFVGFIVAQMILDKKRNKHKSCQTNSQPKNIDKRKLLVFNEIP
jgi:hypothetical protein